MKSNQQNSGLFLIVAIFLGVFVSISNGKVVLTSEEKKAVEKFQPLVDNIITHDYQRHETYLVRWLQARKLNVNDAVEMFRGAQKWRKENKIDTIMNEDFSDVAHFNKLFSDDAVDKEGRTVFTSSVGDFDIRKLVLSGKRDRYERFNQYVIEKAVSKAAEAVYRSNGTLTDSRLVGITDFHGFSLRKFACLACLPAVIKGARENENNYPGISGLGIYINTPRVALPWIESLFGFVSEETRNSIKIFGSDRVEWSKYIQTIISPDQLTYQFGGTKKK